MDLFPTHQKLPVRRFQLTLQTPHTVFPATQLLALPLLRSGILMKEVAEQ